MKWLKLGGGAIVLSIIVFAIIRINSCVGGGGNGETVTVTPADTNFMPVEKKIYQPPSIHIPFLTKEEGKPRLPKGVKETDVQRVVSIQVKGLRKPLNVIETKDGRVFVEKDSGLVRVGVTDYVPPIVQFGFYPGVGATFSLSYQEKIGVRASPMVKLSLIDLWGIVRLPMLAADLDGAGVGVECKLYHDIYIGPAVIWRYEDMSARMLKLTVQYNFQ